ncbi:MAG: response regulator transcription factor [Phycisphaerae bacterium]
MPTILLIDDDASLRHGLSVRLRSEGYEVRSAGHPDAAINAALLDPPDLIILDVHMPRFNGPEFHDCLRVTERGRRIPIVYLSGSNTAESREAALRRGARAFLTKPYDPDELLATIVNVLRSSSGAEGVRRDPDGAAQCAAAPVSPAV